MTSSERPLMTDKKEPTGVNKQAPFRLPLFVCIMLLIFSITVVVAVVVGYITLSLSQNNINEITTEVRESIMFRCREQIVGALNETVKALRTTSRSIPLAQFVAAWNATSRWTLPASLDVIGYHYQMANEHDVLENTGLLFRPEPGTVNQSYLAAYPKWGQIYYQDPSTNFVLRGIPVLGQQNNYSLRLDLTNTSVIRTDWIPNDRFPDLKTNGLVRGQPFWAAPIYTPVVRTFLIPLFWPIWPGLPIGQAAATGDYVAAHFAMMSIKSLDNFLKGVEVSANGIVSLVEGRTGLMLASSMPGVAQNGTQNIRYSAVSNPNALIASSASYVAQLFGTNTSRLESIPATAPSTFATSFKGPDGDDVLVNGFWITDTAGLRWLLLLTIPSNDFLAQIRTAFRNAIISAACFVVGSLLLSGVLSYAITAPLVKLSRSMVRATDFDFSELKDGYLHRRSCVTEIGRLEGVFQELLIKFAGAIKQNKNLLVAKGDMWGDAEYDGEGEEQREPGDDEVDGDGKHDAEAERETLSAERSAGLTAFQDRRLRKHPKKFAVDVNHDKFYHVAIATFFTFDWMNLAEKLLPPQANFLLSTTTRGGGGAVVSMKGSIKRKNVIHPVTTPPTTTTTTTTAMTNNNGDLPECCRTGFLWDGTPSGTLTTIGGVETYIAKPEVETDKYVVIWTDVFGHKNPNARLIADSIAKGGLNCIIPDILNGDPIDYDRLESMGHRPKTFMQSVWRQLKFISIVPSFLGWLSRHTDKTTIPILNAVLDDLKNTHKASKIGVLGYCFGGRYAVLHGGDEPRVDCFAGAHPSQVAVPKDIEAIKKPGLFLFAEEDHIMPMREMKIVQEIVARDKKDVIVKIFPRTLHGFAIRGNEGEEETRKARDESLNDTVQFFRKHLLQ
ncbi:hypothetical protein HDU96_010191 [Phlyctochytrium bullatum]|nr:hypothetical protein HDU96_010191 [Phlyctochytrium bullatum]